MLAGPVKLTIEKAVYVALARSGLGPTQSDSQPLFHSNRANVNASATAITVAGIQADAAVMRRQMDKDSNEYLDLMFTVLLVAVREGRRRQDHQRRAVRSGRQQFQKPNTVRGLFREVVSTPRLSGPADICSPTRPLNRCIWSRFLEGQREPVLESQDGWRVDGTELRARPGLRRRCRRLQGAVTNRRVSGRGRSRKDRRHGNQFRAAGNTMTITAAADLASGQVVRVGQSLCVALEDIANGATGSVARVGVFTVPKVSAAVIARGERLVWDASAAAFDDNAATPATETSAAKPRSPSKRPATA